MILFTQINQEIETSDLAIGLPFQLLPESEILLFDPAKPEEEAKKITSGYFSAASPDVSFDGKFILFSAKKESSDNWQIWEMNVDNLKSRQLTFFPENCLSPAYLPGGHFVFTKSDSSDSNQKSNALFAGNLDGTDIDQISYNPHNYSGLSVLQDGRVLTVSSQVYPEILDGKLMVLRPDGTKQELFYQPAGGIKLGSRGTEITDGKIVFVESDRNTQAGDIIAINYNRPLNSCLNLTSEIGGQFYSARSFQTEKLLTTHRPDGDKYSALYEFDTVNKTLSILYKSDGKNIIDAVVIAKHERPRKLPSEVNKGVKTGLLLCQDINFMGIETVDQNHSIVKAEKIEVMGIDSTLGIVDVEKDGSVYLKILADTPFRLRTITQNGAVVNGPGDWIYLRPNERVGCVGCHAGNEQSPFNRQPLSVKKDPVVIPAHIKGMKEYKVLLE